MTRQKFLIGLVLAALLVVVGREVYRNMAGDWASHMGDIAFTVGSEEGFAEAQQADKPLFLFYTGYW